MSKISIPSLLEEPPIVVYPSLAKALGINQAAVFQQLHYLLTATKTGKNKYNLVNGKWWVYNTYEEWQEYFSWLSESAIKQMFLALEKRGLVVSQQGLKKATDRRKWYTIDYDAWETFRKSIGQNLSDDETKSVPSMNGQNLSDVYTNIRDTTKPLSPATQDDSETLPTTVVSTPVKQSKQAKVKPPTHPLRQRNPDKTPNPYTCAVAFFWSGKPYTQWTASERKAEGFRFNKLFETSGTMETLYAELDGFTPEQLARALQVWVDRHPATPIESRPRENKLVSNIGAILKQIVNTDKHQVLKIGANLQGMIQEAQPTYTDWQEHARIAQELHAEKMKDTDNGQS